jgi:hypothetical protein
MQMQTQLHKRCKSKPNAYAKPIVQYKCKKHLQYKSKTHEQHKYKKYCNTNSESNSEKSAKRNAMQRRFGEKPIM